MILKINQFFFVLSARRTALNHTFISNDVHSQLWLE